MKLNTVGKPKNSKSVVFLSDFGEMDGNGFDLLISTCSISGT